MAQDMQMYRQEIFTSPNGTIESRSGGFSPISRNTEELRYRGFDDRRWRLRYRCALNELLPRDSYASLGSYSSAGLLLTTLNTTDSVSNYFRWLDLDAAVARTQWTDDSGSSYFRYVDVPMYDVVRWLL